MKAFRKIFVLALVSILIATGLFFINSSVVKTSFGDKVGEIVFLSVPVFIVLLILYFVNRALVKSVKGIKNKKPSGEGRP